MIFGGVDLLVAALLTYVAARLFGLSRRASVLASAVFTGSGYFAWYIYDLCLLGPPKWLVGVLACQLAWERGISRRWSLVLGAVCFGLCLLWGRPSELLYFIIYYAAWLVYETWAVRRPFPAQMAELLRRARGFIVMGVGGFLMGLPMTLPFLAHLMEGGRAMPELTLRESEYIGWHALGGMVVPSLGTFSTEYLTLAVLPLSWIGLRSGSREARFLGWSLLIMFLSIPPLGLFDVLRLIPGYEGAISPTRYYPLMGLSLALLAGLGLDAMAESPVWMETARRLLRRWAAWGFGLLAVLGLAVALGLRDIHKMPLTWATGVVPAMALAAWWIAARRPRWAFAAIFLAVMPSGYLANQADPFLLEEYSDITETLQGTEFDQSLERLRMAQEHDGMFRVESSFNAPHPPSKNFWATRGIQSSFQYEAALVERPFTVERLLRHDIASHRLRGLFDYFNIRYLIRPEQDVPTWMREAFPVAWTESGMLFLENPTVLPRAFVTSSWVVEPNMHRQILRLGEPGVLPRGSAVLETPPPFPVVPGATGTARIVSYKANEVVVDTEATADAILVLSDNISRGWTATVDGRPAPLIRANLEFRAVPAPAGHHRVVFTYVPWGLPIGLAISLATLIGMVIWALIRPRRRPASTA